jgi:hypothetical protein
MWTFESLWLVHLAINTWRKFSLFFEIRSSLIRLSEYLLSMLTVVILILIQIDA